MAYDDTNRINQSNAAANNTAVQNENSNSVIFGGIIASADSINSLQDDVWSTDYTYDDLDAKYAKNKTYKNIEAEKFGIQFRQIQAFYNIQAILAQLMKLKSETRDIVSVLMNGVKSESGGMDVVETTTKEAQLKQKYTLIYFNKQYEYVLAHNETVLKADDKAAQKKGRKDGKKASGAGRLTDILGLTDTRSAGINMYTKKYQMNVQKQYYKQMSRIMDQFEKLMQNLAAIYGGATGDSVFDAINRKKAEILSQLTWDNLTVKAGKGGYKDINKNEALALRIALIAFQNYLNIYMMIRLARQAMRNAVTQMMTGSSVGEGFTEAAIALNQTMSAFENQMFSMSMEQLFQTVSAYDNYIMAQNAYKKAKIRAAFSGIPFIGAWLGAKIAHKTVADAFKPSRLNMEEVWELIYSRYGIRRNNNAEEVLNALDQKSWQIVAQLDNRKAFKLDAGDKFQSLNETKVARIQEELGNIFNLRNIILLVARSKGKLRNIVFQEMTSVTAEYKTDPEGLRHIVRAENDTLRLAVEMKVDTIRKEIAENNRQRQEELELEQLQKRMIYGLICMVVMIVLTVLMGGGLIAIFGAAMSGWGLGQSLADAQFNKERMKNIKTDFHSTELLYLGGQDQFENRVRDVFRRAQNWDKMAKDAGNEYQVLDVAKAAELRAELTAIYITMLVLHVVGKSRQSFRDIVTQTMGHSGVGDLRGEVKDILEEKYKTWSAIYNLAMELVQEEIKAHNQLNKAEHDYKLAKKMLMLSLISAVVSIVAPMLGSAGGIISAITSIVVAVMRYQFLKQAAEEEKDFGSLKSYSDEQAVVDLITRKTGNAAWDALSQAEKKALLMMTIDLVESIGHGYYGFDSSQMLILRERIEGVYRVKEALVESAHWRAELRRAVLKVLGKAYAPGNIAEVLSAVSAEKETALNALEQFQKKIESYIMRLNEINDREKAAFIAKISMIFAIISAVLSLVAQAVGGDAGKAISFINKILFNDAVANYLALKMYDKKVSKKKKKSPGVGESVFDGKSQADYGQDKLARGFQKYDRLAKAEKLEGAKIEFQMQKLQRDWAYEDELHNALQAIIKNIIMAILEEMENSGGGEEEGGGEGKGGQGTQPAQNQAQVNGQKTQQQVAVPQENPNQRTQNPDKPNIEQQEEGDKKEKDSKGASPPPKTYQPRNNLFKETGNGLVDFYSEAIKDFEELKFQPVQSKEQQTASEVKDQKTRELIQNLTPPTQKFLARLSALDDLGKQQDIIAQAIAEVDQGVLAEIVTSLDAFKEQNPEFKEKIDSLNNLLIESLAAKIEQSHGAPDLAKKLAALPPQVAQKVLEVLPAEEAASLLDQITVNVLNSLIAQGGERVVSQEDKKKLISLTDQIGKSPTASPELKQAAADLKYVLELSEETEGKSKEEVGRLVIVNPQIKARLVNVMSRALKEEINRPAVTEAFKRLLELPIGFEKPVIDKLPQQDLKKLIEPETRQRISQQISKEIREPARQEEVLKRAVSDVLIDLKKASQKTEVPVPSTAEFSQAVEARTKEILVQGQEAADSGNRTRERKTPAKLQFDLSTAIRELKGSGFFSEEKNPQIQGLIQKLTPRTQQFLFKLAVMEQAGQGAQIGKTVTEVDQGVLAEIVTSLDAFKEQNPAFKEKIDSLNNLLIESLAAKIEQSHGAPDLAKKLAALPPKVAVKVLEVLHNAPLRSRGTVERQLNTLPTNASVSSETPGQVGQTRAVAGTETGRRQSQEKGQDQLSDSEKLDWWEQIAFGEAHQGTTLREDILSRPEFLQDLNSVVSHLQPTQIAENAKASRLVAVVQNHSVEAGSSQFEALNNLLVSQASQFINETMNSPTIDEKDFKKILNYLGTVPNATYQKTLSNLKPEGVNKIVEQFKQSIGEEKFNQIVQEKDFQKRAQLVSQYLQQNKIIENETDRRFAASRLAELVDSPEVQFQSKVQKLGRLLSDPNLSGENLAQSQEFKDMVNELSANPSESLQVLDNVRQGITTADKISDAQKQARLKSLEMVRNSVYENIAQNPNVSNADVEELKGVLDQLDKKDPQAEAKLTQLIYSYTDNPNKLSRALQDSKVAERVKTLLQNNPQIKEQLNKYLNCLAPPAASQQIKNILEQKCGISLAAGPAGQEVTEGRTQVKVADASKDSKDGFRELTRLSQRAQEEQEMAQFEQAVAGRFSPGSSQVVKEGRPVETTRPEEKRLVINQESKTDTEAPQPTGQRVEDVGESQTETSEDSQGFSQTPEQMFEKISRQLDEKEVAASLITAELKQAQAAFQSAVASESLDKAAISGLRERISVIEKKVSDKFEGPEREAVLGTLTDLDNQIASQLSVSDESLGTEESDEVKFLKSLQKLVKSTGSAKQASAELSPESEEFAKTVLTVTRDVNNFCTAASKLARDDATRGQLAQIRFEAQEARGLLEGSEPKAAEALEHLENIMASIGQTTSRIASDLNENTQNIALRYVQKASENISGTIANLGAGQLLARVRNANYEGISKHVRPENLKVLMSRLEEQSSPEEIQVSLGAIRDELKNNKFLTPDQQEVLDTIETHLERETQEAEEGLSGWLTEEPDSNNLKDMKLPDLQQLFLRDETPLNSETRGLERNITNLGKETSGLALALAQEIETLGKITFEDLSQPQTNQKAIEDFQRTIQDIAGEVDRFTNGQFNFEDRALRIDYQNILKSEQVHQEFRAFFDDLTGCVSDSQKLNLEELDKTIVGRQTQRQFFVGELKSIKNELDILSRKERQNLAARVEAGISKARSPEESQRVISSLYGNLPEAERQENLKQIFWHYVSSLNGQLNLSSGEHQAMIQKLSIVYEEFGRQAQGLEDKGLENESLKMKDALVNKIWDALKKVKTQEQRVEILKTLKLPAQLEETLAKRLEFAAASQPAQKIQREKRPPVKPAQKTDRKDTFAAKFVETLRDLFRRPTAKAGEASPAEGKQPQKITPKNLVEIVRNLSQSDKTAGVENNGHVKEMVDGRLKNKKEEKGWQLIEPNKKVIETRDHNIISKV